MTKEEAIAAVLDQRNRFIVIRLKQRMSAGDVIPHRQKVMQIFQLTLTFALRIFEFPPTATPFDSFYFVQVWRDKYVAAFLVLVHQSDRGLGFTCSHNRVTYLNDHTLSSFAVLR